MPNAKRGEVWQIDFGLAAKVRPALVLGCDMADEDRVLVAAVYHTTGLARLALRRPMRVFAP
jgi:mRNA interferase MazF